MKTIRIAILTMAMLTMSIGIAVAVPVTYDVSYDPVTNETYFTNNETSQSALELYGFSNGEIVSHVWLSPGDSITLYEDGTHSPYTNMGENKREIINDAFKSHYISFKTSTGQFSVRFMKDDGTYTDWTEYDAKTKGSDFKLRIDKSECAEVRGEYEITGCLIETLLDETYIQINPCERPDYLPADQAVIKLFSGSLRVETDTDEF
ncbi:MAG: hypothetical protein KAR20_07170, partial [Candidatus Heimdallarchaeota archaeon]|nr:hypothetical protein [Candidatus Heimdallarchaeota archaeon]